MKPFSRLLWASVAVFGTWTSLTAQAQADMAYQVFCSAHGPQMQENLGDRDGHVLQTHHYTCRVEGGLQDKGLMSIHAQWESDKGAGTMLGGVTVVRSPGSVAVMQNLSGTRTLITKDGKVVGWTAIGKGLYTMATGAASPLLGKATSWSAQPSGYQQFTMTVKVD